MPIIISFQRKHHCIDVHVYSRTYCNTQSFDDDCVADYRIDRNGSKQKMYKTQQAKKYLTKKN